MFYKNGLVCHPLGGLLKNGLKKTMLKKARAGFKNKISLDHKNICNFFIHKLFVSYSVLIGTKTISVVYLSCFWWNLFMYFWHFEVQLSYEVSMIALSKVNFPPEWHDS
jgi:hypothetical protein